MHDIYFYDGRIVVADEPVISLNDRGYMFGDGVYDAWLVLDGCHFLRDEHLERFERSATALGIKPCYTRQEIEAFSDKLLIESSLERAMVYFQWSRGRQSLRSHTPAPDLRPILSGFIRSFAPYPEAFYREGCPAIFHPDERQHFCDIKTLNLLGSVMASEAAHRAGAQAAILVRDLGDRKVVTECTHSNCYAISDGVIHTAPLGKLILPGITRQVILEIAHRLGIKVVEAYATPEFFQSADEVWISAASGSLPVSKINDVTIGSGSRPVFAAINAEYLALIRQNRERQS